MKKLLILLLLAPFISRAQTEIAPKTSHLYGMKQYRSIFLPSGAGGGSGVKGGNRTTSLTSGIIRLDNGGESAFSQNDRYTVFCFDRNEPKVPTLISGGFFGSYQSNYPARLQALDQFEGAFIDVHPSKYESDGPGNISGLEYRSGSISAVATLNEVAPGVLGASANDAPYVGSAFEVNLYAGKDPKDQASWTGLFGVDKTGDVLLGSNISKTSFPQINEGKIGRGLGGDYQWATGTRLFFGGDKSLDGSRYNSDPIFMHRFNEAADKSTLRVCVSDDGAAAPTGQGDKMEIGYYGLNTAQWNQGVALFASGEVYAKLVKVTTSGYPDYVFTPEYKLPSLADMETHIKAKGYLPGFKPAAQVEKEGMDLGEQNKMLVEKVEELTLHLIRMQKEIDGLTKAK